MRESLRMLAISAGWVLLGYAIGRTAGPVFFVELSEGPRPSSPPTLTVIEGAGEMPTPAAVEGASDG